MTATRTPIAHQRGSVSLDGASSLPRAWRRDPFAAAKVIWAAQQEHQRTGALPADPDVRESVLALVRALEAVERMNPTPRELEII